MRVHGRASRYRHGEAFWLLELTDCRTVWLTCSWAKDDFQKNKFQQTKHCYGFKPLVAFCSILSIQQKRRKNCSVRDRACVKPGQKKGLLKSTGTWDTRLKTGTVLRKAGHLVTVHYPSLVSNVLSSCGTPFDLPSAKSRTQTFTS